MEMENEKIVPFRLGLTDTEWMRIIDSSSMESALPACCANISALRDALINFLRHSDADPDARPVKTTDWAVSSIVRALRWVSDGHDLTDPVMHKVMAAVGYDNCKPHTEDAEVTHVEFGDYALDDESASESALRILVHGLEPETRVRVLEDLCDQYNVNNDADTPV